MRKSARARPGTGRPSRVETMHVTATICVVLRIAPGRAVAAPLLAFSPELSFETAFNSPVALSRCHAIPESSSRAFGSFSFCRRGGAAQIGKPQIRATVAATIRVRTRQSWRNSAALGERQTFAVALGLSRRSRSGNEAGKETEETGVPLELLRGFAV